MGVHFQIFTNNYIYRSLNERVSSPTDNIYGSKCRGRVVSTPASHLVSLGLKSVPETGYCD
jgi:hypothetical protein